MNRSRLLVKRSLIVAGVVLSVFSAGSAFAVEFDSEPTKESECEFIGGMCKSGCIGEAEQAIGSCLDNMVDKTCCKVMAVGGAAKEAADTASCKALGTCPAASGPVSNPSIQPITLVDPMGGKGIIGAISSIISVFLGLVGAIALLVFVYAGIVYMTAGGADDRVTHAKDTMKYAIIGLGLITFAYALSNFYFVALTS